MQQRNLLQILSWIKYIQIHQKSHFKLLAGTTTRYILFILLRPLPRGLIREIKLSPDNRAGNGVTGAVVSPLFSSRRGSGQWLMVS